MDTKNEISDIIQKENILLYRIGKGFKRAGEITYQTIKQSPDADLFLLGAISNSFINGNTSLSTSVSIVFGLLSAKQYLWGWLVYYDVQMAIKSRDGEISVETLRRRFSTHKAGLCSYFGARDTINEYQKSLE